MDIGMCTNKCDCGGAFCPAADPLHVEKFLFDASYEAK